MMKREILYTGIADLRGIESFISFDKTSSSERAMLKLRAIHNEHRHACMYSCTMTKDDALKVTEAIQCGEYENALCILKELCNNLELISGTKESWFLIPKD